MEQENNPCENETDDDDINDVNCKDANDNDSVESSSFLSKWHAMFTKLKSQTLTLKLSKETTFIDKLLAKHGENYFLFYFLIKNKK